MGCNVVINNTANLRDSIAANSLIILLKFDSKLRYFKLHDLEIWLITSQNNRAPVQDYIKLWPSFQSHWWIQTKVTAGNAHFGSKLTIFLSRVTLKFDEWLSKFRGHSFYTTPSFVHHFKTIGEIKLELQSGNAQFGSKSAIFCPL